MASLYQNMRSQLALYKNGEVELKAVKQAAQEYYDDAITKKDKYQVQDTLDRVLSPITEDLRLDFCQTQNDEALIDCIQSSLGDDYTTSELRVFARKLVNERVKEGANFKEANADITVQLNKLINNQK